MRQSFGTVYGSLSSIFTSSIWPDFPAVSSFPHFWGLIYPEMTMTDLRNVACSCNSLCLTDADVDYTLLSVSSSLLPVSWDNPCCSFWDAKEIYLVFLINNPVSLKEHFSSVIEAKYCMKVNGRPQKSLKDVQSSENTYVCLSNVRIL